MLGELNLKESSKLIEFLKKYSFKFVLLQLPRWSLILRRTDARPSKMRLMIYGTNK